MYSPGTPSHPEFVVHYLVLLLVSHTELYMLLSVSHLARHPPVLPMLKEECSAYIVINVHDTS